jgi:DGQHR domain-containing protein
MNDTIKLQVIKAKQPIGAFYIAKIPSLELLKMSAVDRRYINEDAEVLGVQRPLRKDKIQEIKRYLTTPNATFPNSIIVNVKRENVINENDQELELKRQEDTFTIIDGQHRLFGFEDYSGGAFELILTVFIGLETDLQAEVFSIINSQQTKVDPSLNINLELADKYLNPRKVLVQIAQSFNYDKESPWHNSIKMLGGQSEGFISLSAFVKPLFNLTYPERQIYTIKNMLLKAYPNFPDFSVLDVDDRRYPFWRFYLNQDIGVIYKILLNYFNAFKAVLENDWLNPDSLLNKTTGYNAMIKLFGDIILVGIQQKRLSESFFVETLAPLAEMTGTVVADNYGSSGLYSSNNLYKDMYKRLELPVVR